MSGLIRNTTGGTFLNVKQGYIVKPVKNETTGKWEVSEDNKFGSIIGMIKGMNIVEKKDPTGVNYKELQVNIAVENSDEKVRYILTHRMYKPFSDGLILSLANNVDFSKEIKISAYTKERPNQTGLKPSTLCAVRYADSDTNISWIKDVPEPKVIKVEGEEIKSRKEKDIFIDKLVPVINEHIKSYAKIEVIDDAESEGEML